MKLDYHKGNILNFGDDLNGWLWPRLLPDFFDDDDTTVFLGIGSILGKDFGSNNNPEKRKIVFGCGHEMGYFNEAPNVCNPDWTVYFVRGPRTAKVLGISPELAVGDSAILLRGLFKDAPRTNELISFMPHYHSMDRGNWPEICSIADINLIDPRGPIEGIIQAILRSRLVIAESMHGAIVSDALRVPWLAVRPNKKIHRAKWYDWAEALNIDLHPEYMFASSLTNLLPKKVMRNLKPMENSKAALLVNEMIAHNAARRLNVLKEHEGNLSCDTSIDHAHEVMLGKIEQLRRENDR